MHDGSTSRPDAEAQDSPIFDPDGWRLTEFEAELCSETRTLAQTKFAARAAEIDRQARFPTENYQDLRAAGLLGICIPREYGGRGANLRAYMLAAAEIGRYCGATALTFNMHVSSCLWTGVLADGVEMNETQREEHARCGPAITGAFLSRVPSMRSPSPRAATPRRARRLWNHCGGDRWRLDRQRQEDLRLAVGHADYYGVLCTELETPRSQPSRANTMYIAVPRDAEGVSVEGGWDPLGMRGTVSRTLVFQDVFIPFSEQLMPRGVYFNAARQWPHMFMTLTPSYMGIAQAAYDFTVRYLRGEMPGTPPVKRRMYPTKQLAVAQMKIMLEQTKSYGSSRSVRPAPTRKDALLRAWAAQYSVMENANEIAQLAVRTCGGQAMLRSLHLERLYRDSRCGALMLPWTAELCTDMLGKGVLYEAGESDEDQA